jgi:undecaprenyl-diphosphatase
MLAAIVLGIIQGITEFLPISSTAHLVLVPWFFEWEGTLNSLTFDVALHAGTLVSLLICFWKDLVSFLQKKKRRLLWLIVLGTIPAGLAGVFLDDYIAGGFRSPQVIAIMLVAVGIVMFISERFRGRRKMERVTVMDALVVGFCQAIALLPGTSRSGITISAGLFRGMAREEAARFSFLLSIPIVAGAAVFESRHLIGGPVEFDLRLMGAGFLASLVTGVLAIRFMLAFLKRRSMNVFIVYRVLLAGLILGWIWSSG